MRIQSVFAAAALFVACLFSAAEAAPVTYKMEGIVSGSIGATDFDSAWLSWTLTGDSNDRVWLPPPSDVFSLPFTSQSLEIGGIGAITPTLPSMALTDIGPGVVILTDIGFNGGIAFAAPELFNYDGISSIGPLFVYLIDSAPLPTDQGDLLITNGEMMLEVNGVPEPVTLALFGAGLAGIGAMRRRRNIHN